MLLEHHSRSVIHFDRLDDFKALTSIDTLSYVNPTCSQGCVVTDPAVLARLNVGDDETLVEVPPNLMSFLTMDGLDGEVADLVPPIVHVLESDYEESTDAALVSTCKAAFEAAWDIAIPHHEYKPALAHARRQHRGHARTA